MLIDSYRSMILRFALPATRGFLSQLLSLSLSRLFAAKENLWDQGLLELKFLRLEILSTSFIDFLYEGLGELRSRSLGLKGYDKDHLSELQINAKISFISINLCHLIFNF